jgi:hypothetical protein
MPCGCVDQSARRTLNVEDVVAIAFVVRCEQVEHTSSSAYWARVSAVLAAPACRAGRGAVLDDKGDSTRQQDTITPLTELFRAALQPAACSALAASNATGTPASQEAQDAESWPWKEPRRWTS